MLNQPQARRFPPPCRFYSKGTCRAGEQCLFAHILHAVSKPSKQLNSDLHAQSLANRDHRSSTANSRRRSTVCSKNGNVTYKLRLNSSGIQQDLHSVEVQKAIQKSQIAQLERRYASSFAIIMYVVLLSYLSLSFWLRYFTHPTVMIVLNLGMDRLMLLFKLRSNHHMILLLT
jgi:hypothetical protein